MRIGIVGAGAAGLTSARHVIANGHECQVLELASELGGTWLYTDDVDKDKFGFPVYSAMYKDLKTNLPKDVMGFPDFPIPNYDNQSYLTQAQILQFLNLYAEHFKLKPYIKFNHHVVQISSLEHNKWLVASIYKPTNTRIEQIYDAIMVCNGHYNNPVYPNLAGRNKFKGLQYHSKQYRSAVGLENQNVLIIGAGPSGLDLTLQISHVANKVVLSHRCKEPIKTNYPSNVELKPDVETVLNATDIKFIDGSIERFDVIVYCTGYSYSFPFLDETCGITVNDNHIEPLYKHIIHIEKPSMGFIGIPFNVCAFQMFDLQARYFLASLNGVLKLPSCGAMYEDTQNDYKLRVEKGYEKRQAHMMGPDQSSYYKDLAVAAKTHPIADVIVKLRDESVKRLFDDFINFRNDRYKVIDNETFVKV